VPAWRVAEGDVLLSGVSVMSVQWNAWRGRVRLGLSNGTGLDLAGERPVRVLTGVPDVPAGAGRPATAPGGWLVAVGDRVRLLRVQRGLSQRGRAQIAGVDRNPVPRIETGRSRPYLTTRWRVADGLGVPMARLGCRAWRLA
jgi:DNA-binding XRE family transcriptional regulator